MILAIDIGGTSSKFGLITAGKPEISEYRKFETPVAVKTQGLSEFLINEIRGFTNRFPEIGGVGMGLPGLLSKDRRSVLELPNVAEKMPLRLLDHLEKEFPGMRFRMENDAKCATLGEYHSRKRENLDNFLLVTLGTGIGSGVIIDGQLFRGARGNGLELGHIMVGHEKTLEEQIGLPAFLAYARRQVNAASSAQTLLKPDALDGKVIFECARQGDQLSINLFAHLGHLLAEGLIAAIRLLDVNHILLGGGISGAFEFIRPALNKTLHDHLPLYYTESLKIEKAALGNDAGLIGAAGLLL